MTPSEKIKLIEAFENKVDFSEKEISLLIDRLLEQRKILILKFEYLFEQKLSSYYGDKFYNVSTLINDEKYVKQMLTNLINNYKFKSVAEIEDIHLFYEFFNIFTTST